MAVVIRLQGLRITAGSEDIRNFFTGLRIPDGGVHIVGGEHGEAFIIFASDEDARRAMTRSGGCIKGSPVNLLLSSKSEMQNILEARMKKSEVSKRRMHDEERRRAEMRSVPPDFGPNLSVEIHQRDHLEMGSSFSQDGVSNPRAYHTRKTLPAGSDGLYLYMQGMPFSVTKDDVIEFFYGLQVDDVILMKNSTGQNNGSGLVKFMSLHDAEEGLKRDREYIGSRFVEINPSTERQWIRAGGHVVSHVGNTVQFGRKQSPVNMERRYGRNRTRSNSPATYRSRSVSPCDEEYCILLENLSYAVENSDLKMFFQPIVLKDDQIVHLFDKNGHRSRTCFVVFKKLRDYCAALARHRDILYNRPTFVSPVSKEKISEMLQSLKLNMVEHGQNEKSSPKETVHFQVSHDLQKTCLYVRNLPFDVRKVEIVDFFHGFGISEDSVFLLLDEKGVGLGEALVTFRSEEETLRAESLNGQRFLGSEVMLKCITRGQMKEFGIFDSSVRLPSAPRRRSPESHVSRRGMISHFPRGEYSDFQAPSDDHITVTDIPGHSFRNRSSSRMDFHPEGRGASRDRGDEALHRSFDMPRQAFDGPTCVKLVNLPPRITIDEIYDFCYGYRIIPGSASLQCDRDGIPKGTATVVFQSRQEALTALQELNGRPIGASRIKLLFI